MKIEIWQIYYKYKKQYKARRERNRNLKLHLVKKALSVKLVPSFVLNAK